MLKRYTDANGITRQLDDDHAIALGFDPNVDGEDLPRKFVTPSESRFLEGGKVPGSETGILSSATAKTPARRGRKAKAAEVATVTTPEAVPAGTPDAPVPGTAPDPDVDPDLDVDDDLDGGEDDPTLDDEDDNVTPNGNENPEPNPAPTPDPAPSTKDDGTEAQNKKRTAANGRTRQPRTNA